jgi:hypothetical protein
VVTLVLVLSGKLEIGLKLIAINIFRGVYN